MESDSVLSFFSPKARGVPCSTLRANAPEIAHQLGYSAGGISKGSFAAQGMSMEAKAHGGGVPSMTNGGISASLQSVGAVGFIKPEAEESISAALGRAGMKTVRGPENGVRLLW